MIYVMLPVYFLGFIICDTFIDDIARRCLHRTSFSGIWWDQYSRLSIRYDVLTQIKCIKQSVYPVSVQTGKKYLNNIVYLSQNQSITTVELSQT